jgi:hypothetical protein
MTIEIKANHSLHPGIGEKFDEELNETLAIGIKLLTTPYIGLPVPDRLRNNPDIYAEEVFATADYNERFGDVVRSMVDRGVGEGVLPALAKEFKRRPSRFAGPLHLFHVPLDSLPGISAIHRAARATWCNVW